MERQYIGARYVPKIDGEWNENKKYEALTIVTYLNNSYTSKKPVPIGVLPTNENYWALTGNYNAQVELYRQETENVKTSIIAVNTNIEEINRQLDKKVNPFLLDGKKCVFFGDSITWGDSGDSNHSQVETPFPKFISDKSGCVSVNAGRKSATMCTKTTNTNDFKNQLSTVDYSDADYVFISFCANDFSQNLPIGTIDSNEWECYYGAMNNGINLIRSINKKCEIVFIGLSPCYSYYVDRGNTWSTNIRSYIDAVKTFCSSKNLKYIDLIKYSGIDETNWRDYVVDNTHLTQDGYNLIGECILYNLGGCPTDIIDGDNKWDTLIYPSYDVYGRYQLVNESKVNTFNSYNELTLYSGLYIFEFECVCVGDSYNLADGHLGFHFKLGDDVYCVSPIGIKTDGVKRKYRVWFKLDETSSGVVYFRPTNDLSGVSITNMYIENIKLICVTGNEYHSNIIECTNENIDGVVKVTRKNDLIFVDFNFKTLKEFGVYENFVDSTAFKKIINKTDIKYFTTYLNGEIRRLQITNGLSGTGTYPFESVLTGTLTY